MKGTQHDPPQRLAQAVAPLLAQHPLVLIAVDREGYFTLTEGRGILPLGLRPEAVVGRCAFEVYQDVPWVLDGLRRALDGESMECSGAVGGRFFLTRYAPLAEVWLERTFQCHVEPLRARGGAIVGVVGVALDVTERKRAEQERDARLAAERRARLAVEEALRIREDFLSVASHELSTPLMSLQLAVQVIKEAAEKGELPPARLVSAAEQQCRRMGRLVDELLNVGRIDAGRLVLRPEPVDLAKLVGEVAERLAQDSLRARSELVVRAEGPIIASVDRWQIEQAVLALLTNALKYGGGKQVEVRAERDGATARIVVTDHGIGMDPDRVARIFERFERAAAAPGYGGLGLGLYVARAIVSAHGGTIRVDSRLGKGSTFVVDLPIAGPVP